MLWSIRECFMTAHVDPWDLRAAMAHNADAATRMFLLEELVVEGSIALSDMAIVTRRAVIGTNTFSAVPLVKAKRDLSKCGLNRVAIAA